MAIQKDIEFYKGEDIALPDTLTLATGTNISGWSIQFSFKKLYTDVSPIFSHTVGSGVTINDPVNWLITVVISSSDTSGLPPGTYVYDIQRTDSGARSVLTVGNVNLKPEVAL